MNISETRMTSKGHKSNLHAILKSNMTISGFWKTAQSDIILPNMGISVIVIIELFLERENTRIQSNIGISRNNVMYGSQKA